MMRHHDDIGLFEWVAGIVFLGILATLVAVVLFGNGEPLPETLYAEQAARVERCVAGEYFTREECVLLESEGRLPQ